MRTMEVVNMSCRQWIKSPCSHSSFSCSPNLFPPSCLLSHFSTVRHTQGAGLCSQWPILLLVKMLWTFTGLMVCCSIITEKCWRQLQENHFPIGECIDGIETGCLSWGWAWCGQPKQERTARGSGGGRKLCSQHHHVFLTLGKHSNALKLLLPSKG